MARLEIDLRRCVASLAALLMMAVGGPIGFGQGRSPVAPASSVEAKLVIPETKLLPGVPFEMWIELRNPSDATIGVGLCADMLVRPEGAEPFTIAPRGQEGEPRYPTILPQREWSGAAVRYLVMRPRHSQTLTIPILPELEGPVYLDDARLSPPGRYAIAFRLDYCWPYLTPPRASDLPPEFLGPVTTNEVVIERVTPTGSDARVWQRMQEVTNGKWVSVGWLSSRNAGVVDAVGRTGGMTVVSEILGKYTDSRYFPYALLAASFGAVRPVDRDRVLHAIARFPDSPVIELLHARAAGLTAASCGLRGDPMAAVCDGANAKLKASKRPTTRILQFGREDVPPPPCPPEVDCKD